MVKIKSLSKIKPDRKESKVLLLEKGMYELFIEDQDITQARDFNSTRNNRDNRLVGNPKDKTTQESVPITQEATDFNSTRNNRERGRSISPKKLVITNKQKRRKISYTLLSHSIQFKIEERGKY